ncbi:hypothetical protein FRB95_014195 [Tulasnella sp. JGI-2019a]|nr:hypothetical protein FRB95_014195 [Tulasnella sp. JGI-2019a]
MYPTDWDHLEDCVNILENANSLQQVFSTTAVPTISQAFPAFEHLQTKWEEKLVDLHYEPYHDRLHTGLDKLGKYYQKMDMSSAFLLGIVLHPYFKFHYINMTWGGEAEAADSLATGNTSGYNWTHTAHQ